MKVKSIKHEVTTSVTEKLTLHQFIFDKKKANWIREINGGEQIFDLLFYDYPNEVRIKPVFQIKLHLIEDIYHQVTKKEKKYNYATMTLGNSLGQLIKYYDEGNKLGSSEEMYYSIENEKDIEILSNVIPLRFEEYVLPYFNSNSSIKRVDELLNETPRELSVHNWLYPMRACIALIAAKLVNNPNYIDLVKIYGEETKDANPDSRKEFEDLVRLLEKN